MFSKNPCIGSRFATDRKTEERAEEQTCMTKLIAVFYLAKVPKNRMDPDTGNLGTVFLLDFCITSTQEKNKFFKHVTKSCILIFREVPALSPDFGNGYSDRLPFAFFSPTEQILSENLKIYRDHFLKRLTDEVI
jgi:hypothetical protein